MNFVEIVLSKKKNDLPFVNMSYRVALPGTFVEEHKLVELKRVTVFYDEKKSQIAFKLSKNNGKKVTRNGLKNGYYYTFNIEKELKAIGGDYPIKYLGYENGFFILSYSKKRGIYERRVNG